MQRRWEEQLAAYVTASFKVLALGNVATESIRLIDKLMTGGASVLRRSLCHGRQPHRR